MYYKEMYFYNGDEVKKGCVRSYKEEDIKELIQIQKESFPPPFPSDLWWNKEQLLNHISKFPEGALCVEVDGRIVGSITGLLVQLGENEKHTWEEITDDGYIGNHNENGNTLYIVDVCVRPSYRKYGLGKWLMQSMYEVVVHRGVDRLLGGGRMPGYVKVAEKMTPEQYVNAVIDGELKDPVITFLLRCGRVPVGVMANYLEDEESKNFAVLMEWRNPFKPTK